MRTGVRTHRQLRALGRTRDPPAALPVPAVTPPSCPPAERRPCSCTAERGHGWEVSPGPLCSVLCGGTGTGGGAVAREAGIQRRGLEEATGAGRMPPDRKAAPGGRRGKRRDISDVPAPGASHPRNRCPPSARAVRRSGVSRSLLPVGSSQTRRTARELGVSMGCRHAAMGWRSARRRSGGFAHLLRCVCSCTRRGRGSSVPAQLGMEPHVV